MAELRKLHSDKRHLLANNKVHVAPQGNRFLKKGHRSTQMNTDFTAFIWVHLGKSVSYLLQEAKVLDL